MNSRRRITHTAAPQFNCIPSIPTQTTYQSLRYQTPYFVGGEKIRERLRRATNAPDPPDLNRDTFRDESRAGARSFEFQVGDPTQGVTAPESQSQIVAFSTQLLACGCLRAGTPSNRRLYTARCRSLFRT